MNTMAPTHPLTGSSAGVLVLLGLGLGMVPGPYEETTERNPSAVDCRLSFARGRTFGRLTCVHQNKAARRCCPRTPARLLRPGLLPFTRILRILHDPASLETPIPAPHAPWRGCDPTRTNKQGLGLGLDTYRRTPAVTTATPGTCSARRRHRSGFGTDANLAGRRLSLVSWERS